MIVIPIKQLKEDGISSCVYHGDKVGNTLKLPKGGQTQVLQDWC